MKRAPLPQGRRWCSIRTNVGPDLLPYGHGSQLSLEGFHIGVLDCPLPLADGPR
jgi:hypothetical protein